VTTQICRICEKDLPITNFYSAPGNISGLKSECKECYNKLRRGKDKRGYDPKRHTVTRMQKKRRDNPEKYKAQTAVSNAVRDGRLKKAASCEICGNVGRVEGHHEDYSKLLEVKWLCASCHRNLHHGIIRKPESW